jgi:hypothetical protein
MWANSFRPTRAVVPDAPSGGRAILARFLWSYARKVNRGVNFFWGEKVRMFAQTNPLILLVPASVVEGHFVIQLDEHQCDGRIPERPRQVADMTGGVGLRALVLA